MRLLIFKLPAIFSNRKLVPTVMPPRVSLGFPSVFVAVIERFQAFSVLGTFVPGSEKTIEKTFTLVELSVKAV